MLFTIGLTSALLMILSVGVLLHFFGQQVSGDLVQMVRAIGVLDLAMVALMLVPTAAIFAAVLLSISVYAKS
jgi:sodium transport system permease protein